MGELSGKSDERYDDSVNNNNNSVISKYCF